MTSFREDWTNLKHTLKGTAAPRDSSTKYGTFHPPSRATIVSNHRSATVGSSRRSTIIFPNAVSRDQHQLQQQQHSSSELVKANAVDHSRPAAPARDLLAPIDHRSLKTILRATPTPPRPSPPHAEILTRHQPPRSEEHTQLFPNPLAANPIALIQSPRPRLPSGLFRELLDNHHESSPTGPYQELAQHLPQPSESPPHPPAKDIDLPALWVAQSAQPSSPPNATSSSNVTTQTLYYNSPPPSPPPSSPLLPLPPPLLKMAKSALLIVDMQNHFASMTPAVLPHILKLAGHFSTQGQPIFVTQHGHSELELAPPFTNQLVRKWGPNGSIAAGSKEWELLSDIEVLVAAHKLPVVAKNTYDAFLGLEGSNNAPSLL